jgi:hypothetical protein
MVLERAAALPCGPPLARLGIDLDIELGLEAVDLSRARTGLAWASAGSSRNGQHNDEGGTDGGTSTGSLRRLSRSRDHPVASPRAAAEPGLSGAKTSSPKHARSHPDRAAILPVLTACRARVGQRACRTGLCLWTGLPESQMLVP